MSVVALIETPRFLARLASRDASHGRSLVHLSLAVTAAVRATHTCPGQYVSIVVAGENGYFVIASAVERGAGGDANAGGWDLLVKGEGTVAEALLAAPLGTEFSISSALGTGFPCDEARGRRLVIAVAGTGLAAAPPLASRRIEDGDAAITWLFVGLRRAEDLPLERHVEVWRGAGVHVVLCLSRDPGAHGDGIAHGYVQDIARAYAESSRAHGAMMFAVGPGAMVEAMRSIAQHLGVAEADVRTNY